VPTYLNGSLAGDYGYDPLGLGKDTETVEKYRAYELLHARWAMLAAAGIIIPEGLQARAGRPACAPPRRAGLRRSLARSQRMLYLGLSCGGKCGRVFSSAVWQLVAGRAAVRTAPAMHPASAAYAPRAGSAAAGARSLGPAPAS